MTTQLRLGVVAAIDPTSTLGVVAADVLRHELTSRLGSLELDLRTTEPNTQPLERTPWLPWRASEWPHALDALLVDARVASQILPGGHADGGPVVIETDLWRSPDELVALFASQVDDVALDVRTRMLRHLGVLGDHVTAAGVHIPLSALDRYIVALATAPNDPVESALAHGVDADRDRAIDELDAIARRIQEAAPERSDHQIALLHDRIAELETALTELQEERAGWLDALDTAAATRLVLERRQVEAELSTTPADRGRP